MTRTGAAGGTSRPPSVDALARSLASTGLPHPLLVDVARSAIRSGAPDAAEAGVEAVRAGLLQPVINATGVLLHTNLGRAPLAADQTAAYTNLELDLVSGGRGSRQAHAGSLLARACGAEAALVVNNGAAAVLLMLAALARGEGVAVSRGELIQLGGGFRLPDVMAEAGVRLVEVGTTNRTSRADYAAVAEQVALVVKVHPSNYLISGFTEAATVPELADLAPPLAVDVGSGLLDASCPWLPGGPPAWLACEPAVRQTLEAGADLVTFSGDKLLGGPQAGIIAGRRDLIERCAAHRLYRALRPGGLVLGALQDVAFAYLARDAHRLPFWQMATVPVDELRARAERLVGVPAPLGIVEATACRSVTGGGSCPGVEIPSWGLSLRGDHTARLRRAEPRPIIARVRDGATVLDLRTVDRADDASVRAAVAALT